ncbi:hypothetical protein [Hymenobacter chitinivorans]|uniref:TonB-dependent SusC/RagA subfamily outer membrane receptor n=1 Tax=Hymenobacter chitinivorans DSM 11115 TaxID=1121954 RepID=A0A2M9AQX2_9BACT|nr:hypothetical protein [Hymenobacter chitinivorans]PJJ48090.1 hypothetical protein CLV45_4783 [Hymenobacter chitinivorans DSM 11115]
MSAPLSPNSDFLLSKTDAELLYLVQNPGFYHADLIIRARHELSRRGISVAPPPLAPAAAETAPPSGEAPARNWLAPALGAGLVVAAAALFFWPTAPAKPVAAAKPTPPAPLASVATHQLPAFDSLTTAQLRQMPAALPAAERADTTAQRKFLNLARRFWEAENQSSYLFDQVVAGKTDATFPGQVAITQDKWRRLTTALRYSHRLQPTMLRELAQMRRVAVIRTTTLEAQRGAYEVGAPVLNEYSMLLNDSVLYLRQGLLGVPPARRLTPGTLTKTRVKVAPAVKIQTQLPPTRPGHNPVYVLDGELLASDAQTGEAPSQVQQLAPDDIQRVTVLDGDMAVRAFGPRAHSGAVIVVTKAAAQREQ